MFRLVLLTALCAVLTSVQAGPRCTKCNQARDDEETCNNQEGMEPHYVDCADDEVCTTDVRCDGQGRLFFIKGCQKNPSAMDTLICNPEKTRCHYHCDMDMCNENAPPEVWESLKCYDDCNEVIVIGPAECTCECICEDTCDDTTPEPTATTTTPEPTCCTAGDSAKNGVVTYDGRDFTLDTNNKFIFSEWGSGTDQCKFQLRVDTEGEDGDAQVGWAGFAAGVHLKNSDKFERNYRISLKQGKVEARGRGYDPTVVAPGFELSSGVNAANPNDWTFMFTEPAAGKWKFHFEVPALGCAVDVIYYEGAGPNGNDILQVCPNEYYGVPGLAGMCGDRDGDPSNDDQFCPGGVDFSDDCIEGAHQGNG